MATFNYIEAHFKDGLGVVQAAPDAVVERIKRVASARSSAADGELVRIHSDGESGLTLAVLSSPKRARDTVMFGEDVAELDRVQLVTLAKNAEGQLSLTLVALARERVFEATRSMSDAEVRRLLAKLDGG